MARRKRSSGAVPLVGLVKKPEQLEPGKVRCVCGKVCKLTSSGRIRLHKTPRGEECAHVAVYREVPVLDELPPVRMRSYPKKQAAPRPRRPRPTGAPPDARQAPRSMTCDSCGKDLYSPDRKLCGYCLSQRKH
jgi:hypothetical protein